MIRHKIIVALRFYRIVDLFFVALSFRLAVLITVHYNNLVPEVDQVNELWRLFFFIIPLWSILLHYAKLYSSQRGKSFIELAWNIFRVHLIGFVCVDFFLYLAGFRHLYGLLVLVFILISIVLLIGEKLIVLACLHYSRKQGRNIRYVLIVGVGRQASRFINTVNEHAEAGFKLIGCLGSDPQTVHTKIHGVEVIGVADDLYDVLHNQPVDEVIFALPLSKKFLLKIRDYLFICKELGVNGRIITDFYNFQDIFQKKVFVDELLGIPLVSFSTESLTAIESYAKSLFDFFCVVLALIVLAPFMAVIALAIKLSSPGPVIFKQERSGLHGRVFTLYKFRSMVKNAEAMQSKMADLNEMSGPVFKVTNDARIFPLGAFLRRSSLDELPQLFNVLLGDMSLVGPRPLPTYESVKIRGEQRRRLSMKPGLTCIWQISGRNNIDFADWMKLDLGYIDNWSFWLDIKTLLKTIPAIIKGGGAK